MALKGKIKIEDVNNNKLNLLVYGGPGAGKSHFCCSFPNTCYMDTENLHKYKKYRDMLKASGGEIYSVNSLDEIYDNVRSLLKDPEHYSTIVIDSLSNIYKIECEVEADRLAEEAKMKNKGDTEGNEFGRNRARPTRKVMRICQLLERLDMNVIVTCHEKDEYDNGVQVGKAPDIATKATDYSLGTKVQILDTPAFPKRGLVKKSRYAEVPQHETIEMSYPAFKKFFGEDMFTNKATKEDLASIEQIDELNRLVKLLSVEEKMVNKWLAKSKSASFDEMESSKIQACIDMLTKSING